MFDSIYIWLFFNIFLAVLLFFDFVIISRKEKVIAFKQAALLTVFWKSIAALVGLWIFLYGNTELGIEYTTAFISELALSIDNLFVFIIIFNYFSVPDSLKMRALTFGIVGALIARAIFITIGVAVISKFGWVMVILGIFLIFTAYKLAFKRNKDPDPKNNLLVKIFTKFIKISANYEGYKFFIRSNSKKIIATPFFLTVIVLASTDIVFAVDSIPTVFGITDNAFIVWSSNAMAVLGLRPLFFLISNLVDLFRFLQFGLATILFFIGSKMIFEHLHHGHIIGPQSDVFISMGIIIGILFISILVSIVLPSKNKS
ncbi:MAG: tellurium resistance protein TerC [Chloroflexi bacterium]|nr:tellurium resistance protein TerC [Chloroflexota bacterium]|tara:strand:+ start:1177 stop:2121 length:945 start_codon:yes stop_codon:yes gene_type:complete